jgi:hypothetical protein
MTVPVATSEASLPPSPALGFGPCRAFRLTQGRVWSTDTPSKTYSCEAWAGTPPHRRHDHSHDCAGEPIDALPALRR